MEEKIAIVGLGYVGLPLACEFARKKCQVIGFDTSKERVRELNAGNDPSGSVQNFQDFLSDENLIITARPDALRDAKCIIVCVPTPIDDAKCPDLSAVLGAAETIGAYIQAGALIILESTVFPGATEEVFAPRISEISGLAYGKDWFLGYSPERINPGDTKHTIATVVKVVAGMNHEVAGLVANIYRIICGAGVHIAPSIRVAEAAKVFENVQRDLGVAAVNELALICDCIGIQTQDVLNAAATKWNFLRYYPGLVGGHCIGVDPYYLAYAAERAGHHPEMLLAGRRINNMMPRHIANGLLRGLIAQKKMLNGARVLILGCTFKQNVPDTRNSKVRDLIEILRGYQIEVVVHDPLLSEAEICSEFGIQCVQELSGLDPVDGIVVAVLHDAFRDYGLAMFVEVLNIPGVVFDVTGQFRELLHGVSGIQYRAL